MGTLGLAFGQGAAVLALVAGAYGVALATGLAEGEARAFAFTTLIAGNLGLIFANRSWTETILARLRVPNRALWLVTGGALLFLGLVLYAPGLQEVFRFERLAPSEAALALTLGLASIVWFEVVKLADRGRKIRATFPPAAPPPA
jgi:Ca2+-transporting ATPase